MTVATIYETVAKSDFAEELYQSDAHEVWYRAIAALEQMTLEFPSEGMLLTHSPHVFSGLQHRDRDLQTWVFGHFEAPLTLHSMNQGVQIAPLSAEYPHDEWFCLILTRSFSAVVLASHNHQRCLFSLHPDAVGRMVLMLQNRVADAALTKQLMEQLRHFPIHTPTYKILARFSKLLLSQVIGQELIVPDIEEIEIIRAIAHEVRTPLATIRTLTHSLLKRPEFDGETRQRLLQIERECKEQVDRFNLIFEAAQIETYPIPLETTYLDDLLQENCGPWQEQASRRQVDFEMITPESLPAIQSNLRLLSQVLNGLVDRLTRSLPPESYIQLQVTPAGEHVKLQFLSQVKGDLPHADSPLLRAVGQWLMLQPETGTVSLSLPITKTIFQALGGKLTVRLYPNRSSYDSEVLTIFLPIYKD